MPCVQLEKKSTQPLRDFQFASKGFAFARAPRSTNVALSRLVKSSVVLGRSMFGFGMRFRGTGEITLWSGRPSAWADCSRNAAVVAKQACLVPCAYVCVH